MDELIALSDATLSQLASKVSVPNYDRGSLRPGIVHIGLGNFHRAHQAWYLHRLMQQGNCRDWAIIGAGVRPADSVQREKLLEQDFLTTLIELHPRGKSAEIVGSMIDYLSVEARNRPLIECMARPEIRIVSLTITEGGYYTDPASGEFDVRHPDIVHDAENPDRPRTVFGAMIAALRIRRQDGYGPLTGLSCDNLQGNGAILRRAVVSLAKQSDPDLAAWIEAECSFPNSMVDCIVPATGTAEIALAQGFGIDDRAPVTHERFRQWVIEDRFCAGRPDWDRAGATFSDRVHDFEKMKLRILNGGHQIIAMPAQLLGIATVADAMSNVSVRSLLRKVVTEEIAPHVAAVPDMSALQYFDLIEERFSNPEIADGTRRVAFDGSSRQSGFIVPSIRDGLRSGTPVTGLALVSALWAHYCAGRRQDGGTIEPNDPNWNELHQRAKAAKEDPFAWLGMRQYYGDLAEASRFSAAFGSWLQTVSAEGVLAAIENYITGGLISKKDRRSA